MAASGIGPSPVGRAERRGAQVACTVVVLLGVGGLLAGGGVASAGVVWGSIGLALLGTSALIVVTRTRQVSFLYIGALACLIAVPAWFALLIRT